MRVLVAGGSGFVGRHVAEALLEDGHEVLVLDRGRRPAPHGVRRIVGDVVRDPIPHDAVAGADAIVNLVGIKRPDGAHTFEAVHVGVTRKLIEAARAAAVPRFVHVSVVCSRPDAGSPYHDTKWRAEALARDSGLHVTILKPAVIYGAGDDMLTHLVKMIRFVPVFPIVGRGASLLQPVDVRDVARAVKAALERPETAGRTYDVVGPERLTLRRIVRTVADGLGLPLAIVPTPVALMRPMVAIMSALSPAPLSTPAQLRMLQEGLVGDPEPARRELGLEPRAFDASTVRAVEARVPSLFGASLRFVSTDEDRVQLARFVAGAPAALGIVIAAIAGSFLLAALIPSVWYRMAAAGAMLTALSFALVPLPWRALFRPTVHGVALGVASAAALYATGAVVFQLLQSLPWASAQIAALYAWRDAVPRASVFPLLVFIIAAEEIVWRNAVTLPLAARFGPLAGATLGAAGFALAHVAMGVPLLVPVALGAGWFWSALVVRTRSAVPALVSHLLWDLSVLFVFPYTTRP
jgi:uncharacterized protein YbjT (DUF2867 family)/membrane protease YdiL (CAAX protease family)